MQNKIVLVYAVLFIVLFPVCLYANFAASGRADGIKGPGRIVPGPGYSLYVLMDKTIALMEGDGTTIASWTFEELGLDEELADMGSGPDGSFYVGLLESGKVHHYSAEGALLDVMPFRARPALLPGMEFWRLMVSPDGQKMYIAETNLKNIAVYDLFGGPRMNITGAHTDQPDPDGPDLAFHWPSRMLMHDGLLYAADSNHQRVLAMRPDGLLVDVYETVPPGMGEGAVGRLLEGLSGDTATGAPIPYRGTSNPIAMSIEGRSLYVITINPAVDGWRLLRIDLDTHDLRVLAEPGPDSPLSAPKDVFVRDGFLLVADEATIFIEAFDTEGTYLGVIGSGMDGGFDDDLAHGLRTERTMLRALRMGALGLMVALLMGLIIVAAYDKRAKARAEAGEYA